MTKSLLNILSLQYPLDLTKTRIEELKLGPELFEQGFFTLHGIKKNYSCDNCSEFHEVIEESGEYFYVCNSEHGGKESIRPDTIKIYRLNLEKFLQYLAEGLNIKPDVQNLNAGSWKIGSTDYKSNSVFLFYSQNSTNRIDPDKNNLFLTGQDIENLVESVDGKLSFNINKLLQMLAKLEKTIILEGSYTCGDLNINTTSGTLDYKDQEMEISPQNSVVKFLILLMINANKVVKYTTIAKETNAQFYQDDLSNKQLARDVQYFKRDLGRYLKEIGLNSTYIKEIKDMIQPKTNLGYKLICK